MKKRGFNLLIILMLAIVGLLFVVNIFHPRNLLSPIGNLGSSYFSGSEPQVSANNLLSINLKNIDKNMEIPLNINIPVYSLSLNGHAILNSDDSLIRVIMKDSDAKEYLLYELYPLIADINDFDVLGACEETCLLGGAVPKSIRVIIIDATLNLDSLSYSSVTKSGIKSAAQINLEIQELKNKTENLKIKKINEQINERGQNWIAGETPISKLSYSEKKSLFTYKNGTPLEALPNLQGFEYYKGGVFELPSANEFFQITNSYKNQSSSKLLPSGWDWRFVHGENWLTPIRDQGWAGTCWAFAEVGTKEAQINLQFNQHLDVNLSEQMLIDCINAPSESEFKHFGLADELCDPYSERDIAPFFWPNCNYEYVCNNFKDRSWKVENSTAELYYNYNTANLTSENLKRIIIRKGPLDSGITTWHHAMVLMGYMGNDNWKTIQYCNSSSLCDENLGCATKRCYNLGEKMNKCNNRYLDSTSRELGDTIDILFWPSSYILEYSCVDSGNNLGGSRYYYWKLDGLKTKCDFDQICVNNTCVNQSLYAGFRNCEGGLDVFGYLRELKEYSPGNGETIWIFKNSWGADWGENGYGRVASSVLNLGYAISYSGPIYYPENISFLPTGFNGNANCFDKDNDGYCNWGISEVGKNSTWRVQNCPLSCSNNPIEDCDDSSNNLGPYDDYFNCMAGPGQVYCKDSDANATYLTGLNYYVRGIADGRVNGIGSWYEDRCLFKNQTGPVSWQYVRVSECNGTSCILQEGYCTKTGVSNIAFSCPYGCRYGSCSLPPKCKKPC